MIRRSASLGLQYQRPRYYSAKANDLNWLEKDCVSTLKNDKIKTDCNPEIVQEVLRGSHAGALLASKKSQQIDRVEEISEWMARNQSRPSLLAPVLSCIVSSSSPISSTGYVASQLELGLEKAKAEYYNDQIRELYVHMPEQVELKETLKKLRDDALAASSSSLPDTNNSTQKNSTTNNITNDEGDNYNEATFVEPPNDSVIVSTSKRVGLALLSLCSMV